MNHGRTNVSGYGSQGQAKQNQQQQQPEAPAGAPAEEGMRVDGFAQVLDMLKIADSDFRESLLRRLALRDIELATSLRIELRKLGLR